MRTTVSLDDELYRSVKERAAREGRTVASVMEEALRIGLEATVSAEPTPASLPTVDGALTSPLHRLSYGKLLDLADEAPSARSATS